MIRIALKTTGCKVNQADGEALRRALSDLPCVFVPPDQPADVVVVNACAVTRAAERDGRAWANRGARAGASVVLAGCMANKVDRAGGDGRLPEGVAVVPGTADRSALVARLRDEVRRRAAQGGTGRGAPATKGIAPATGAATPATAGTLPAPPAGAGSDDDGLLPPPDEAGPRARPLVKVQDGCDCRCAYCIVPLLRGPSASVPLAQVEEAVRAAAAAGAAEAVLAGVDLASWGRGTGQGLAALLRHLASLGTGLRFRLSSVEPHGLTGDLLQAMAHPDVCRHLHVPLQSGSEAVLRAMRRPHGAAMVADRVRRFADALPGLALGLDVIVGFPGETDGDFQATRALVESLPVTYLHVFPFSPRPGTAAEALPDDVPPAVKAARSKALRDLSAARKAAHAKGLAGRLVEVVDVRERAGGVVESLASDYTRVLRRDPAGPRPGRLAVRVTGSRGADALAGPPEPAVIPDDSEAP